MSDDVEPVPAVQLMVAEALPAAPLIPLAADGGATGVTLYWPLHVVPAPFFAPT